MERVYNFSAGPSMMPLPALETAAREMTNCRGRGMSVMEMSHRSKMYLEIYDETAQLVRELMAVPDSHAVLFLQGGATGQFAAVPLNLMGGSGRADYIDSGNFASAAIKEAKKFGQVSVVASSREQNYVRVPEWDASKFDPSADYFHITTNNTIFGTRFTRLPDTGSVPLVADASSNILSEPIDVARFGVLYAGAQKNLGPAGVALVLVKKELMGRGLPQLPAVLDYAKMAAADSMLNTPPTYAIYMAGLCLKWLKDLGGVAAIERTNIEKANLLYDYLDNSAMFKPTADRAYRSRMNVTFVTGDADRDAAFVKAAAARGLVNLAGHRLVGGMRASIYNAMPIEGVAALVDFMKEYEAHA